MGFAAAGDKTLYAYYRTLTFDCGKLASVGGESQVTILPFTDCT